jgi:hypothetical protein
MPHEQGGRVNIRAVLRTSLQALATFPLEIVTALWRLIVMLLIVLLMLLRFIRKLIRRICHKHPEHPRPKHCCEVPPHIKRKPDPCLYSQFYLMAQGLSVTWDNPDIWITLPDGTPVPSHTLQPSTKYLVHARIHNASFDPALGTAVRCLYRPYSFNSPERVPIEVLADGSERVVVLHIPRWQSEIAVFRWTTPPDPNAHWCLQAECRHPDDKNPNNNLGQENTQVLGGTSGARLTTSARLFNTTGRALRARLTVDQYVVPTGEVSLKLDTRIRHLRRKRPFDNLRNLMVNVDPQGKLRGFGKSGPVMTSYVYRGFQQLRRGNERGAQPIDPAWLPTLNGQVVDPAGHVDSELSPEGSLDVPITFTIPPVISLQQQQHRFNVVAVNDRGRLLGGLTIQVEVT